MFDTVTYLRYLYTKMSSSVEIDKKAAWQEKSSFQCLLCKHFRNFFVKFKVNKRRIDTLRQSKVLAIVEMTIFYHVVLVQSKPKTTP